MAKGQSDLIHSKRIYEGSVINLRVDLIRLAGGRTVEREIIEHGGAVAMVALDDEEHVYLVRQYRSPVARSLLEIPAGGIEVDEKPEQSAERELQEEIGFFPGKLEHLGAFHPVPGYSSELIHLFLARALRPSKLTGDPDEEITVERMPLAEALRQVDEGLIEDGKTLAGLLCVARILGR